ncbi:MAG: hypothetical protein ACQEP7_00940, partial [bacterium]
LFMNDTGRIYRLILPVLLAAVFSAALYSFQVLPPEYGEIIYDCSLLGLLVLFFILLGFIIYSRKRSGQLLCRAAPGKNNRVFLFLGLLFLLFGLLFTGFEIYFQRVIHGSFPSGPVLLLAGIGSIIGWRLPAAVYNNGIRPPCRNFIGWEKIKSFSWLEKVILHTSLFFPPGGEINFSVPAADSGEFFCCLLGHLPLEKLYTEKKVSKLQLNSPGLAGYYFSVLDKGEELIFRKHNGTEVFRPGDGEKKENEHFPGVEFSDLKELLEDLTANTAPGNDTENSRIKFERREKEKVSTIVVNVEFSADKVSLVLDSTIN